MPRNSGSCGVSVSLAGKSLASVTAIGSSALVEPPVAATVSVWVPFGAFFGTSSRNSSETLELVAGIAAATGWPPPINVAVQPAGTPDTDKRQPLGRQVVILQPQIDRRGFARPQRHGRIVAHEIEALDVLGRVRRPWIGRAQAAAAKAAKSGNERR